MLRNYRATPHSSTGKPPATALFNRPMRIKVPNAPSPSGGPASIKHRDQLAKAKMKTYADRRVYVKPSSIATGDKVLVRRNPSRSSSGTPYNPKPFVVTNRKGTMVTAESEGRRITRNSSFFKKLKPDVQVTASGPGDSILAPHYHVVMSRRMLNLAAIRSGTDDPQLISKTIFRNSLALMTGIFLFVLFSYNIVRSVCSSSD